MWCRLTVWPARDNPAGIEVAGTACSFAEIARGGTGTSLAVPLEVLRSLVASATATAFLATGCAAERPWPLHPVAISDRSLATLSATGTIDILPLDLQLWAEPGYEVDLARVRDGTEVNLMSVALDALARRNYAVGATIDWNGDFPGGNALSRDELLATVSSLSRYGAAAAEHPGQLPVPFLPARLGGATGADATLYVGGWGYVAKHRETTGEQVAQGIAIALLVISVIAIIALISKKSSRGHSHGGRGGGGGGAVAGGHGSPGGAVGRGAVSASRGAEHVRHVRRAATGVVDAFGRAAIDIAVSTPDWGANPMLPHDGGQSQLYLEMTLVDNRTGLALWHAHQTFPASAASAADITRAARTMMNLLPARPSQAQAAR
jgi:uncharacterized membrane protein YgcG